MTGRVRLAGLDFDLLTQAQLLDQVTAAIARGDGGSIVTPNIDICRQARRDQASRGLVAGASVAVPDGMPLLWAARLAGRPLAERVTGADLIFSLAEAAAANAWPICVLGGQPGSDGAPGTAELAGRRLAGRYPGIDIAGTYSPPANFDARAGDIEAVRSALLRSRPKVVFVGLGFPKQEQLIARLRPDLPDAWFVGCGAAVSFAAGIVRRAPRAVQRAGLEWAYRLLSEPRRLARRYLVDDLPFAIGLLAVSAWQRRAAHRMRAGASSGPGRAS